MEYTLLLSYVGKKELISLAATNVYSPPINFRL